MMIHQCYFRPDQVGALFQHEPYTGFGLEPEVNPDITAACPELRSKAARTAVLEHAAFLWHWRNPRDTDPWIGFTSYRQLGKGYPFVFRDRAQVESALAPVDIACWGGLRFNVTLSQQAEMYHPGINEYLGRLFGAFHEVVPRHYHVEKEGGFANYWVMRREDFERYMEWFTPKMVWCLAHANLPYAQAEPRWLSYVLERLFIIWYMQAGKRVSFVDGLRPGHGG
jgi:hypothetical protein